jgi:hypothetical protein
LLSTYDAQGLPHNFGIGHGWVEGGPLLPIHTELYQSALGAESLRALASLAHLTGKEDVGRKLGEDFSRQQALLNKTFWSADTNRFAFALDQKNQQVDEPSVLAAVPMWFGLVDDDKAGTMIGELATPGAILPGVVGAIALILALYLAAVLPVNVTGLVLIAPGESATFEIEPLDWIRRPKENATAMVAPAVRLLRLPTLCLAGTTEDAMRMLVATDQERVQAGAVPSDRSRPTYVWC